VNRTTARIVIAVAVLAAIALVIDAGLRRGPAPTPNAAPRAAETSKSPSRRIERTERVRAAEPWVEPATEESAPGRAGELTDPPPMSPETIIPDVVTERKEPEKPSRNDHVVWGLRWLKGHQSEDGSWHDPATTGVALLAFLGAGQTHQSGSSRENVKNGLKHLRGVQDAEGCLVPRDAPRMLRDHAVAALALVEAYGMTGSRVFKEPAQRALAFAMKSRTPSSGWHVNGILDVETTGWMSMLVTSAKLSELDVDVATLDDAVRAIDQVTHYATGRVVASDGRLSDEAATAIGMLVRQMAGRTPDTDPVIRRGADLLVAKLPAWEEGRLADPAAWYFGTIALSGVDIAHWKPWAESMGPVLDRVALTDDRGGLRGSWDPPGASPSDADRVWTTAYVLFGMERAFYAYKAALMHPR
jgi:hypothetical protein